MREYLTAMDATAPPDVPPPTYATILGANSPKMLGLAATLTDGALPAGSPPTDTADTRGRLGPDKLLVIYLDASHADIGQVTATVQAHLGRRRGPRNRRRPTRRRLPNEHHPPRTARACTHCADLTARSAERSAAHRPSGSGRLDPMSQGIPK